MYALMVGALRNAYPSSGFDTAVRLNHPLRTDLRVILRAGGGDGKEADDGDEVKTTGVEITNMKLSIPHGTLCVFALPGEQSSPDRSHR